MSAALVSGGASGLGAAVVRRLRADGREVVVLDLPGTAGEALADETGGRFTPGDVRDEGAVAAAVAAAGERGPLRVAVCCAGVLSGAGVLGRAGPHPLPTSPGWSRST